MQHYLHQWTCSMIHILTISNWQLTPFNVGGTPFYGTKVWNYSSKVIIQHQTLLIFPEQNNGVENVHSFVIFLQEGLHYALMSGIIYCVQTVNIDYWTEKGCLKQSDQNAQVESCQNSSLKITNTGCKLISILKIMQCEWIQTLWHQSQSINHNETAWNAPINLGIIPTVHIDWKESHALFDKGNFDWLFDISMLTLHSWKYWINFLSFRCRPDKMRL